MDTKEFDWKERIPGKSESLTIDSAYGELLILLDKYDWFYDCQIEDNTLCVYVDYMTPEVLSLVPQKFYGFHIKVGFASHYTCGEKYGAKEPRMFEDTI